MPYSVMNGRRLFALSLLIALPSLTCLPARAQTLYNNLADFDYNVIVSHFFLFEGAAPANGLFFNPNLSPLTINIEAGDDTSIFLADSGYGGGAFSLNGTDSLVAGLAASDRPTVTFSFGSNVTAFAMEMGFRSVFETGPVQNSFTAQLFRGNTAVGAAFSSANPALFNAPTFATGFFGVTSATPFDSIRITPGSIVGDPYLAYDNLRFGSLAPEPGTLALLIPGLFGLTLPLAGVMRHRMSR